MPARPVTEVDPLQRDLVLITAAQRLIARVLAAFPGLEPVYRRMADTLLASRDIVPVTFRDWRKIEAAEIAAALDGNPREKFTSVEAMLAAIGR